MKNYSKIAAAITYLLEQKMEFALYRLPNETQINLIIDLGKKKQTGFVLQPYNTKYSSHIISEDVILSDSEITIENIQKSTPSYIVSKEVEATNLACRFLTKDAYEIYVAETAALCATDELEKAVAARIKGVSKPENFQLGNYFVKLLEKYPTAFVNLYFKRAVGLWAGATPELLVRKKDSNFETVSLAATKLISEKRSWTAKEEEEQQIVTDYVQNVLETNGAKIQGKLKAETVKAGAIEHIKTKINFESEKTIFELAKLLHPTPAVCGFPKEEAKINIRKYEGNQRQMYAGFIGLVTEKTQALFVNLRCMRVIEKECLIYVGAGITKDSNPEKEWLETENKAITLLGLLVVN